MSVVNPEEVVVVICQISALAHNPLYKQEQAPLSPGSLFKSPGSSKPPLGGQKGPWVSKSLLGQARASNAWRTGRGS